MSDRRPTLWRPIIAGCLGSIITLALFVGAGAAVVWAIRWLT